MDPFSAIYLVLTLVQTTNNAYRLVNSIRYSAPKVDQIYYRLLSEKETTEAWANQMRMANGTDLQTSIPPDKLDEVTKLLSKLVIYVKRAEDKYAKVELKSADQKNTIANLRARAQFVLTGYDDLKDLVDAIASMNKALTTIAPPLPPYSRHMYSEGSTHPQIQRLISDDGQPLSTPGSMDGTTAVETPLSRAQTWQPSRTGTDDSTRNVYDLEHLPSLQSIYELCLNAMQMMAYRGRHALIQNSVARLKLWGTGIFEPPVPLDNVLMLRKNDSNAVRQAFLKAMAHILVLQGMFLPHLCMDKARSNTIVERDLRRPRDSITGQTGNEYRRQTMQADISSMLGTDELVESALASWANFLQRQKDLAAVSREHSTREEDDLRDIEAMLDYNSISKTIELLFGLLPAIRSERHTYSLFKEAEQAAKDGDSQSLTASIRAHSTVEDDIHKIEDFVKKRDARAVRQGRRVTLYEPVFRKEKDRLEALRHAEDRPPKFTLGTSNNSVIQEKRDQLAKILGISPALSSMEF